MNPDENIGVLEAARAIAAGRRVDWAAIESSADVSQSLAALLEELKVVEGIAALHRSLPDPGASASLVSDASVLSLAQTAAPAPETATWGSLHLLERVGQGAFGDVYRAWDPRLDREVALKLLRQPDSRHDSVGSLVVDEGRLLARVRHPNVVTVHGADRIDGRVGLWMEFVRGRTIEVVLRDHGPFSAQEAALIGLDLCRALSAVHRAGLIHRDIKAHNVMREDGGRIVLMDFGTGREDLGDRHAELAGTPLYLAPEVFEGTTATARSDIYSVGVLLYHLVSGSYPVKGRTVADIREAHAQRKRSWLRDERPDLSDAFVQAVERALEFDPDRRYESAGAIEASLSRVVSASDSAAMGSVVNASAAAHAPMNAPARRRARLSWILGAGVAASVAAAIAVAPASWRDRLLGRSGGSPPARSRSAALDDSSAVVRRVSLPHGMYVGAPSFDGKLFSMVDDDGNIVVVELATGHARRVTVDAVLDKNSQFAELSAISPDNQSVAYGWRALDGKYELRVIDMDGRRPRVLLRSDMLDYPIPIQWTRDGKSILASLERTDHSIHLALVSAATGAVRTIKEMGHDGPRYASISPDGEFVVYDAPQGTSTGARDIFIVRADGSDDRPLAEHPANDANPVWTPDGRRVLFASDRSSSMDVWAVPVSGGIAQGEPQVVRRNIGRMNLQGLTDSGSYFYFATVGAVDVYQADLGDASVTNAVAVAPSYSGSNISSVWSPDGRRIAYASRRGLNPYDRGSSTVVIRDLQSPEQHEFIPPMKDFLVRSWSADGRSVLIGGTDANGKPGMYAVDVETGRTSAILSGTDFVRPEWLTDGRLVYFVPSSGKLVARNVQTGAEASLVDLRAEGIEPERNITGRGFKLSPDGATAAYAADWRSGQTEGRSLSVKVLGGGAARELLRVTAPDTLQFQDWMPDGSGVLFTRWIAKPGQPPITLWRVSIHGGDPQPLGLSMPGIRDVSVHPDGKRITFTAGWPKKELWVMENFLNAK